MNKLPISNFNGGTLILGKNTKPGVRGGSLITSYNNGYEANNLNNELINVAESIKGGGNYDDFKLNFNGSDITDYELETEIENLVDPGEVLAKKEKELTQKEKLMKQRMMDMERKEALLKSQQNKIKQQEKEIESRKTMLEQCNKRLEKKKEGIENQKIEIKNPNSDDAKISIINLDIYDKDGEQKFMNDFGELFYGKDRECYQQPVNQQKGSSDGFLGRLSNIFYCFY